MENIHSVKGSLADKFTLTGIFLGLSLILIYSWEHSLLGKAVVLLPLITVVLGVLGLTLHNRNAKLDKWNALIAIALGLTYLAVYFL